MKICLNIGRPKFPVGTFGPGPVNQNIAEGMNGKDYSHGMASLFGERNGKGI